MVDKKIKKILIFACPRVGSTIIQKIIADELFGIPNLIEPFHDPELGFNPGNPKIINGNPPDLYKWTQDQPLGVIKLLAIDLGHVDTSRLLSIGNFDRVVVIERKNLVDCCISLCLASTTRKFHYYKGDTTTIELFECDKKFVTEWICMYQRYLAALTQIKNSNVPYDTICYEDFMSHQIQYIANVPLRRLYSRRDKMISLNLPYQDLCVNYNDVEEQIKKELC